MIWLVLRAIVPPKTGKAAHVWHTRPLPRVGFIWGLGKGGLTGVQPPQLCGWNSLRSYSRSGYKAPFIRSGDFQYGEPTQRTAAWWSSASHSGETAFRGRDSPISPLCRETERSCDSVHTLDIDSPDGGYHRVAATLAPVGPDRLFQQTISFLSQ